ncbi:BTB/POZ domain-containing protein 9-like, partial [Adelges cooleyi]|uniref:BTB/POZ domain-containing protein 9-like n=1 Tax=Adelges cooleyi TaxID=133065 RepID=UPI00217F8697
MRPSSSKSQSNQEIDHTHILVSDMSNLYVSGRINLQNVCSFLVLSQIYQYKELEDESLDFIDNNALDVLRSENFLALSSEALLGILNRDTFYSNEFYIFNEVCRWITENEDNLDRDSKIEVLSAVRYHLMSDKELADAKESKLVTPDIILDAIEFRNTLSTDKPQFRGQLKPDVSLTFESRRSPGINVDLIDQSDDFSDRYNYDGTNMIKLNTPSFMNYIEISLWDEVKVDKL